VSDDEADRVLAAGAGTHVDQMLTYTAAGRPSEVREYLLGFRDDTGADELITVHPAPLPEERLRSITLLAQIMADTDALG
jgi:alkanesulfonate monooxygenase SsuD/methylene tetrahydromethanopterin reductase-like flavin-dependent oxidoreductase (luciferase family)